jgi:hypothetical protein
MEAAMETAIRIPMSRRPVGRARTRAIAHRREPRPVSRDGVRRRADQAIVAEYLLDLSERHGHARRERSAADAAQEFLARAPRAA